MTIFNEFIGAGFDHLPQFPVRYQIGLKSGHLISDHCGEAEKKAVVSIFSDGSFQAKKNWQKTVCLRGFQDYTIRSSQISFWMEIGKDVFLTSTSLKKIKLGLVGNHEVSLMVDMTTYRSLMDLFVPRDPEVNAKFKQAVPIGSAMRFRLYTDPKKEAEKITWDGDIVFLGYSMDDNNNYRKVRIAFRKEDFIFLSQNGGAEWY